MNLSVLKWPVLAVAAAAMACVPLFNDRYMLFVAYFLLLNIALAQSWNLVGGYSGLVSLGHAAFFGIGAYSAAVAVNDLGLPIHVSFVMGGIVAAAAAVAVSFLTFRFLGIYFAIGTLVLAEALRLWMINWEFLGGAQGMQFPVSASLDVSTFYYLMLALAAGATVALMLIVPSKLGFGLRAMRDNEESAQNLGVNLFRTKLSAFVISAAIAGLVGAVHANRLGAIEPYSIFNAAWTIGVVNIVIIGGIGTITGPIVGALFVAFMSEALADYSNLHLIVEGVLLILVIRFMPNGLWGFVQTFGRWLGRALAPRAASDSTGREA